ncbi:MAG TPA: FAD-dependent oxidoreductase, partial [Puia sp.]
MDLHSDSPYWLMKDGMLHTYPSLQANKKTDIVIMGAGITGAIIGYHLNKAGLEVMLVDKRHAATGSTCASTALLQYEIDIPLIRLVEKAGEKDAVRSYRLCLDALTSIKNISEHIGHKSLEAKPSLQYASFKKDAGPHYQEYLLRKKYNFPVDWLSEKEIKRYYHLSAPGAILSAVAAQTDPYELADDLLQYLVKHGSEVYDATEIKKIVRQERKIELTTGEGYV